MTASDDLYMFLMGLSPNNYEPNKVVRELKRILKQESISLTRDRSLSAFGYHVRPGSRVGKTALMISLEDHGEPFTSSRPSRGGLGILLEIGSELGYEGIISLGPHKIEYVKSNWGCTYLTAETDYDSSNIPHVRGLDQQSCEKVLREWFMGKPSTDTPASQSTLDRF